MVWPCLISFKANNILQNGNLINTSSLMQFMDQVAHRHINTASDSELLLNIFADNLQQTGKFRINEDDIFAAIGGVVSQCKGAYACVAMLAGFGIIAFRDPNGIRPVGMASRKAGEGFDYLFASESVVADACGFTDWEDVKPGRSDISSDVRSPYHFRILSRRGCHYHPEWCFAPTSCASLCFCAGYLRVCVLCKTRLGYRWCECLQKPDGHGGRPCGEGTARLGRK